MNEAIPYVYSDGGKSLSRRKKNRSDCVVRAFVHAFGFEYDDAYDLLANLGRKSSRGTPTEAWQKYLLRHHKLVTQLPIGNAIRNEHLTFGKLFQRFDDTEDYMQGVYLVHVHRHLFTLIDGEVYDICLTDPDSQIHSLWKVK